VAYIVKAIQLKKGGAYINIHKKVHFFIYIFFREDRRIDTQRSVLYLKLTRAEPSRVSLYAATSLKSLLKKREKNTNKSRMDPSHYIHLCYVGWMERRRQE
jgi:hypothetical protein